MTDFKPCRCGSGLTRYELLDAAGICCTFVCETCEPARRKEFKAIIFESGAPYAASGEEADIDIDKPQGQSDCRPHGTCSADSTHASRPRRATAKDRRTLPHLRRNHRPQRLGSGPCPGPRHWWSARGR
jgi:hypothetical protein